MLVQDYFALVVHGVCGIGVVVALVQELGRSTRYMLSYILVNGGQQFLKEQA